LHLFSLELEVLADADVALPRLVREAQQAVPRSEEKRHALVVDRSARVQPALVLSFYVLVQEQDDTIHVTVSEEFLKSETTFAIATAHRPCLLEGNLTGLVREEPVEVGGAVGARILRLLVRVRTLVLPLNAIGSRLMISLRRIL